MAVSLNNNTSSETLHKLACHEDVIIRRRVATDLKTSSTTLAYLANDSDLYVRESVAANANTNNETLEFLSHDEEHAVLEKLIYNQHTPYNALKNMLERNIPIISHKIMEHLKTENQFKKEHHEAFEIF
jgi:hypothetical protein